MSFSTHYSTVENRLISKNIKTAKYMHYSSLTYASIDLTSSYVKYFEEKMKNQLANKSKNFKTSFLKKASY